MVLASFDTTPASSTITVLNTDDFVPVFPPAMQVERNPQKKHNSHTNIYYIHIIIKLMAQNYTLPKVQRIEETR
jgi:hypothetical protein